MATTIGLEISVATLYNSDDEQLTDETQMEQLE